MNVGTACSEDTICETTRIGRNASCNSAVWLPNLLWVIRICDGAQLLLLQIQRVLGGRETATAAIAELAHLHRYGAQQQQDRQQHPLNMRVTIRSHGKMKGIAACAQLL